MIKRKLAMGEYESALEVIIRGNGVYITDVDDDNCVFVPHDRWQELSNEIDSMLKEQGLLRREAK